MTVAADNDIYGNRELKTLNGGEENVKSISYRRIIFSFDQTEKREFFLGSRYGRSQGDMASIDDDKIETPNPAGRIMQRNDRFFLGSRYGKRSSPVLAIDDELKGNMKCVYTGVKNFFRCIGSEAKK